MLERDDAQHCAKMPWMVIRTRSRHEYAVEFALQEKRVNSYLPRHSVVRRWNGTKRVVQLPLFPGYVFVQPRLDQYEGIRYIRGSCGLIFSGERPAQMSDSQIETVRILAESGADLCVSCTLLPGQRVKVLSGPMAGAQGEMVRVKDQDRLVINVQMLGSCVSVEIDSERVMPI